MPKIIGIFASNVLRTIQDFFARTTSGSLGTANTGQTWVATRGTWFANGSAAQSNDAANTYPIASVSFSPNATMKADTTGGTGLAFWVSDANNWWGAYPFYSSSSVVNSVCNASYGTFSSTSPCCGSATTNPGSSVCNSGYGTFSSTAPCCGSATTNPGSSVCNAGYSTGLSSTSSCCASATPTTTYSCPSGGTLSGSTCNVPSSSVNYLSIFGAGAAAQCAADGGSYSSPNCNFSSYSYSASSSTTYACYTSYTTSPTTYSCYTSYTTSPTTYSCYTAYTNTTVTTYVTNIRVISSVSGSVVTESTTSLTSNTSGFTNVASMQVDTISNSIVAKAYSSAGQTTQIGTTITRNPTSPNQGAGVGIIKAPTDSNQGSTLDNYSAT